ncbi:MAG: pyruvate kinase, partial [Chloroflexota bacterium]
TQMLESMMGSPRPTRAEASDVANAVIDGADAVQLSGETSVGLYPVQAVSVMSRIIEKTETAYPPYEVEPRGRPDVPRAVAHAACLTARELGSRAIVVLTRSGTTARLVSRNRPQAPIIALAGTTALARQLALWWGVSPLVMEFSLSTEATLASMEEALLNRGLARPGDEIVVVGSAPFLARGRPNFVKVHRVGKPG